MNTLSNFEIIEICKEMNIPLIDIFFKDSIPNNLNKGFYIINLQSKDDKRNGTHWTSFYYDGIKNIYYDSFGFKPPEETEIILEPYIYNDKDIQNINSSSCGFYCIAFIKFLSKLNNKIKGFEKFIELFDKNTLKNELILDSILYNKKR